MAKTTKSNDEQLKQAEQKQPQFHKVPINVVQQTVQWILKSKCEQGTLEQGLGLIQALNQSQKLTE